MSVGKKIIYELVERALGSEAKEWLDTPQEGLGDTPDVPVTPRSLVESGCPTCINSVVVAAERIGAAK